MKLLHIDSSILGEQSASRVLTREIVAHWQRRHPEIEVQYRDLAAQELPHLSGAAITGQIDAERERNAQALADFQGADVLVVGAPTYNFAIPSQLKAWIDRIAVAGKTFRYTASGPQGLAGGKQVIVALARGGVHDPSAPGEFVESYLRHLFGFLGIDTVTFIRAEGLSLSAEHRRASLSAALDAIQTPLAAAA
jgi:FMN-dependent NADH-azoreductase